MHTFVGMRWGLLIAVIFAASAAAADPAPQRPSDAPTEAKPTSDPTSNPTAAPNKDAAEEPGTGGAGSDAQDRAASASKRGLDALGVPLASYNSDLGWGLGAVGGGYYYVPGYTPYRHALAAQIFLTTGGVQNHWLRYDGPSLIGSARLEVRAEYRRELFAPYYGPGNASSPEVTKGAGTDRALSFDYFFPGGWARIRTKPWAARKQLEVFGGYGYHFVRVAPYDDSALKAANPLGMNGGHHGQLFAGAFWDTRDNESDPSKGSIQELSFRLSNAATVSRYNYGGFTLSDRHYFTLGTPKLIFAQRFVLDALVGDAPFFEWSNFGGTSGGEGIGGMSSVRGVPRNRYQGKVKAISNSELRFYPLDAQLFKETTKFGGVLFFDTGRVWHDEVSDGPWHLWHSGVGAGLRIARRAAVIRFDVALATETWQPGVYVTFGHMY